MKYIIRIAFVFLACAPLLASAQLPSLVVCGQDNLPDCNFFTFVGLANNIIKFLIVLGTAVFTIMFMYAGWLYLTAVGNQSQITRAHGVFKDAIIGFVIMLGAWLFIDFILSALLKGGGRISNFRLLSK